MPETMKIYYKDGTSAEMDAIDAQRAVREHPSEWSAAPFPEDYAKAQAEKVRAEQARKDAERAAAAEKFREEAAKKAAEEQAERDVEAARIADEQEEKRKADEAARAGNLAVEPVPTPVTNDGLKVGHIPSEVPALEAPVAPFEARDKGQGWWGIFDSKGTQIGQSLRKGEGESFNKMTPEEQDEYVKAELAKS